jgi:glutathione S-transferase
MITLYQFPISHYCEKIRWALAYKQLDYKVNNLLPGPHRPKMTKMTGASSVPVLVHDGKTVANSSDIITYLDATFPSNLLTPEEEDLKEQALEWERFADSTLGVHVRRLAYGTLLDYPDIVVPFFTDAGPWYGRFVMRRMFPTLRAKMRELMDISDETVQLSNEKVAQGIDKLNARLAGRRYIVGDRFTRADLAAASLLAPLCRVPQYGLQWPETFPEPLQSRANAHADRLEWVTRLYDDLR